MSSIKNNYLAIVIPKLITKFNYKNIHEIPKIKKIQINSGLGLNAQNRNYLEKVIEEIRNITGQHPIITKSKKAIAGFKIRKNIPLGVTVTLRREKMYTFLEKLIKLTLPRTRDFRGLNPNSFDKNGNYNLSILEQSVFPELDNMPDIRRGFNITIVTSAKNSTESLFLLKELGMPFINN